MKPGYCNFPAQLIGPPANSASYWSMCHTSATLRAAAATPDLHTLQTAVKAIGCACEGLRSQASTNQATNPTTIKSFATLTTALLVEVNFTVNIFESSDYLNDGNEEDCNFTNDQGVEATKTLHRW